MSYLERIAGEKKIIWFQESNRYMVLEMPAYEVISRLEKKIDFDEIVAWCADFYQLPENEAERFTGEVQQLYLEQCTPIDADADQEFIPVESVPTRFYSRKYYKILDQIYLAEYETEHCEYLIHPKFAHLETSETGGWDHCFQLFLLQGKLILLSDGKMAGQWALEESHVMVGRYFMELLNCMHRTSDEKWMAVFHASALSYGNDSILFLGDSGSGKSTISAILMASGLDLLADDFVPVNAATGEVFNFPAAVSVKKSALNHLIPIYPQLDVAAEFYYPDLDKTVRYLPPSEFSGDPASGYPCKALVFVKYRKESGLILEEIPKDVAFQHLVPDSWISPLPENASKFMDWFLNLPCYSLTYSDNEKMVGAVKRLWKPAR